MKLAKNLKALLRSHDLSVSKLARATKVPRQTIDNWLVGQEPRSLNQVKKVADYFDVPVDHLCFELKAPKTSIEDYGEEINAGIFEVVLRRVRNSKE